MRDAEVARIARALRRRRGWRQEDVAVRAGIHRSTISLVEGGHFSRLTLAVIRRCFEPLQADLELTARWRGAELDRLLDEQHSWLQSSWKAKLERWGWAVQAEASFNHYGERGRIDLLAWYGTQRVLLVVEIKTEIVDSQALLGALDVKLRVAPITCRELGWGNPPRLFRL
jgi:transcriptional regulator with XRE-family HTH domain